MSFLPLTLGVRPASGAGKASPAEQKKRIERALKRDDYACRFCGFRSKNYQRALPWDEGKEDPPLVTTCIFCEQCLSLERAGITGAGLLLWLPEIPQTDLNHIVRAIYVARVGKGPAADLATRALDALTARRAEAKKRLGSDDPLLLATILRESFDQTESEKAVKKLDGIRLLPAEKYMVRGAKGDANQMPSIAKFWLSPDGPYGLWPPAKWQETFKSAMAQTGTA